MLLLTVIRQVFTDNGDAAHNSTTELIEGLHQMDETPWAPIKDEGMTLRRLSGLLAPYGAKSRSVRGGPAGPRGYSREDLWDALQRYCPNQSNLEPNVALVADTREGERTPLKVARDEDDWADLLAEFDDPTAYQPPEKEALPHERTRE